MQIGIGIGIVLLLILLLLCVSSLIITNSVIKPKRGNPVFREHREADNSDVQNRLLSMFQETTVTAVDGTVLNAYKTTGKSMSRKWAICVHGYGGAPGNMAKYADHFIKQGFNVLLPELRGHNRSDDLNTWIKNIQKTDSEAEILLFGLSMGGAATAASSALETIDNVRCLITDSAPSSMYLQLQRICGWVPVVPKRLVFSIMQRIIKRQLHFDLKDATILNNISNIKPPWLIIHGASDGLVDPQMAKDMYNAANCLKELYIVLGAEHTQAEETAPEQYWATVDSFTEKHIGNH